METQAQKPRRQRPKPVKLTEAAAARIAAIMAKAEGQYQGVRVGVTNGGCAGMSYTMDYAESQGPLDEAVEDGRIAIHRTGRLQIGGCYGMDRRRNVAQQFFGSTRGYDDRFDRATAGLCRLARRVLSESRCRRQERERANAAE